MKLSRPSIPPTLAAGIEVGGYVLGERIGCGGFGEVYAAHQPTIGRRVAIKVLHAQYSADPDAVKRFVDEARAVNRILHSGIVEIFDFGRVAGRGFFVMELIEGKSLRALLAERGHLPLVEALPLFRGIAEAVDAAHAAQIAHRDLKPDNVFVLQDGRTKLIDFGLAKLVRDRDAVTETGSVFGTPLYMSPEQCRGKAIDTRTDLYSFGVLVYHVLVGQPPFEGEPIELALKHLNERPQPPSERRSELSRNVDRVVLALLAKDPAERPPSLMAACGALAGSSTLRIRRTRQAKRAVLGIAGIALVAAGVAYVGSRDSSIGGPACRSGGDRIAIAWSPARSAGLASRFAEDGDRAVWRVASERLDAAAARWAAAWDRACTADVNIDALLHEQRKTCLENALVEFVATVDFFAHVEPASFSDDFDGDIVAPAFSDCDSPAVLRAQAPAPSPATRSQIEPLYTEAAALTASVLTAQRRRDAATAEQQLARLDALARRVEQLNPPAASFLILWRLGALDGLASDIDQQRRPGVRDAIAEAIRRFEISRDDVALASAEVMLAQFELGFLGRPEALDRAVAQVARAERAVERAGRPVRSDMNLAAVRGTLALWQGSFEEAARGFRAARAIAEREGFSTVSIDGSIVIALARGGRVRDAVAEARDAMARQAKVHGDLHPSMAHAHGYLAMALELSGDHEAALVERRISSARIAAKRDSPPLRTAWGRIYELELELRLGKTPIDARAVLHAIAGRGATPRLHNRDALATVRRAGLFSVYVWGVAHGVAEPEALADHAATLAFWRGDHEAAARLASGASCRAAGCADWVRFSRWLAVTGEAKSIDRQLAALERDYDLAPLALAYSGVVLATLGRWSDARPKLEAARGEPNIWENQADLSELDTWLALARIETGDRAAARPALEESLRVLSISHNGTDGFTYTMPVAQRTLADLVWETGDHLRARDLMTRARDGFGRLGPLLDSQRMRAERWLADHPH